MIGDIGTLRLQSQNLSQKRFSTAKEVVSWMGAMQAQDLNSAKWAIGARLEGITEKQVDDSIGRGEIIRTHLMRPTWHLVSIDDYLPILRLTAPAIRASLKSRRSQLELDSSYFKKSNPALQNILGNGNHLTREELMQELSPVLPALDSSRMNHILLEAELEGMICNGRVKNKQHSFALTDEWLPAEIRNRQIDRNESLALLAGKYFKSHGPATLSDFSWWSGLSMADCRTAVEMVKGNLESEKADNQVFWYDPSLNEQVPATKNPRRIFLLPAYDEYIISYKDRSAVLTYENHGLTVSSNGIFRPVIVLDGQVIGLWNKTIKKGKLIPDISWFIKPESRILKQLDQAFKEFALFLELNI